MTLDELKKRAESKRLGEGYGEVVLGGDTILKLLEMIAALRNGCTAGAYGDVRTADQWLQAAAEIERSLGE